MPSSHSIRALNWAFLVGAMVFHIMLIVIVVLYVRLDIVSLSVVVFCIVSSLVLTVGGFFSSRQYVRDFEWLVSAFQWALDTESFIKIPQMRQSFFVENKKLESVFKQVLLRNNLARKDLTDLKEVFAKFVPQDIYREIWYRGYERIALGNCVSKRLTVMFLDIMGFTRISENLTPDRTLPLLNIYFDGIGEIIHEYGGYIDKFLGDGVMVLFDHTSSDAALHCAKNIIAFMERFRRSAFWEQIDVGIGINSWEVIVGTIGTKKRMDATVIGDNVNIAARLQSLTRKYKKNIIVSQSIIDGVVSPEVFRFSSLGEEILAGKEHPVSIWSVDHVQERRHSRRTH